MKRQVFLDVFCSIFLTLCGLGALNCAYGLDNSRCFDFFKLEEVRFRARLESEPWIELLYSRGLGARFHTEVFSKESRRRKVQFVKYEVTFTESPEYRDPDDFHESTPAFDDGNEDAGFHESSMLHAYLLRGTLERPEAIRLDYFVAHFGVRMDLILLAQLLQTYPSIQEIRAPLPGQSIAAQAWNSKGLSLQEGVRQSKQFDVLKRLGFENLIRAESQVFEHERSVWITVRRPD